MSAPFVPALDTFEGGQMTDLPSFTATVFEGSELFEIVSGNPEPTTPNNAVNYSITSGQLATILIPLVAGDQVVIAQGQHSVIGDPYIVQPKDARIYVHKAVAEPTYIQFGNASAQLVDVLVKDVSGTADGAGNGIFNLVTADGVPSPVPVTVPFGGFFFRPVTTLNIWTLGTS